MGAVASGHGTGIRGTSRASNQGRRRVHKSYIIAGVSHWDRPRIKHHRSRHVSTGVTEYLDRNNTSTCSSNRMFPFPNAKLSYNTHANHTSVDYMNILLVRQTASTRSLTRGRRRRFSHSSPVVRDNTCLLYTSPSPRDLSTSRMPSSA